MNALNYFVKMNALNYFKDYAAYFHCAFPIPEPLLDWTETIGGTALVGGLYGYLVNWQNPNAGAIPSHYAVWFTAALGVSQIIKRVEELSFKALGTHSEQLLSQSNSRVLDRVRGCCWKVITTLDGLLDIIDHQFSKLLGIRDRKDINKNNIDEAFYLEMCRYRIWRVAKRTFLSSLSFSAAHDMTHHIMGLTLPKRSVPVGLLIEKIVMDILILPAFHQCKKMVSKMAEEIPEEDELKNYFIQLKSFYGTFTPPL